MSHTWTGLLSDPLFQLNLSLWLTRPRHAGNFTPRPILREAGYEVYYIEPELNLPPALQAQLAAKKLPHSSHSEPEIIFRGEAGDFIIWECKCSLFGYEPKKDEREYRQARTFLLTTPSVLASALGLPSEHVKEAHLTYLSVHKNGIKHMDGVHSIAAELTACGLPTNKSAALLLKIQSNKITLGAHADNAAFPLRLAAALGNADLELAGIDDPLTDPRPLYYFPWTPEAEHSPNDYNSAQFGNRILAAVVQKLGPLKAPYTANIRFEDILASAYNPFFPAWRNRSSLQNLKSKAMKLAMEQIGRVNIKKEPDQVKISQQIIAGSLGVLTVTVPTVKLHRRVIEALRKGNTSTWLAPVQGEFEFEESPTPTKPIGRKIILPPEPLS